MADFMNSLGFNNDGEFIICMFASIVVIIEIIVLFYNTYKDIFVEDKEDVNNVTSDSKISRVAEKRKIWYNILI